MSVAQARLSEAAATDINEQADWYEEKSDRKLAERWSKAVTSADLEKSAVGRAMPIQADRAAQRSEHSDIRVSQTPDLLQCRGR